MIEQATVAAAADLPIHRDNLVWNACDTTSLRYGDDVWVRKLQRSGVSACLHTVAVDESPAQALKEAAIWRRFYDEHPALRIGLNAEDAREAKAAGQIAMYMHWQGIGPLGGDLDLLDAFHALGLRVVQPTYQYRNLAGDGCGERVQSGLSRFGVNLVDRCNKLGVALDVSHVGDITSMEIVEMSRAPVMATHVGVRAINNTVRNKPDDLIKAIAKGGGLIGIAGKSGFLRADGLSAGSNLDDYIAHMKHICDLVGPDYVAIGTDVSDDRRYTPEFLSDFHRNFPEVAIIGDSLDASLMHPAGLKNPGELANVTEALLRHGFSDEDVVKIIGGNVERVLKQALQPC
ncbi:MAG: membrane dipeptidase [Chelatococcus sp.]|uniref:dipeptidase n=1 Tax=unclassified Chelatococcus TaxID=2638111 RepID=UPI001BCF22BF|nr:MULTISPECIES: membrane dipeptidase [unclassified Chelatococcus]CAH1670585.1 putative Membrane dipeptidase [Hyphomicrobiales bacterium]MBS7739184.1 membrane dipeptidase [Chelatococcus sp. HY11]MBX3540133.1 membrane dipeptidase [Chelatococcus sp.]MBX3543674.1 membrane dipeptidase [Chelatococcus sp.]MCO5076283.1 dipeptidase [Chelatococcus sp.]